MPENPFAQYKAKPNPFAVYKTQGTGPKAPTGYAKPGEAQPLVAIPGGPDSPEHAAAVERARSMAGVAASLAEARGRAAIELAAERQKQQMLAGAATLDPRLDRLTGDDFLKALPSATASTVKALVDGRMAFPAGAAMRSPYWQNMLANVAHADPNFDAVNYNARSKTRADFTSGQSARNIKSLNTAIGHLGHLSEQISGTASHGGFPFATTINQIQNAFMRGEGKSGPTLFDQTSGALASELTQVFRGSGGAEADVKRYLSELSPSASLEQKQAAVKNIAGLLQSRLEAVGDQYKQGMGKTIDPLQLLNPHAQQAFTSILGPDASGGDGGPPQAGGGPNAGGPGGAPKAPMGGDYYEADHAVPAEYQGFQKDLQDRINSGDLKSPEEAIAYAKGKGFNLKPDEVKATYDYVKRGGQASVATPVTEAVRHPAGIDSAMLNGVNMLTLGTLPKAGAALGAVANKIGGSPLSMGQIYGRQLDSNNATMDNTLSDHPVYSALGSVAGMATGEGLASGVPGIARMAGFLPKVARPIAGDALFAGATAAGGSDNLHDALTNGLTGTLAGAAGSFAGQKTAGLFGRGLKGVTNPAVKYLQQAGVPMTGGQMLGGTGKAIEDKLTSIPLVGDIIKNRRAEGYRAFNQAAFNEAGQPIGAKVDALGDMGLATLDNATSDAYSKALDGVSVNGNDPAFLGDMQGAVARAKSLPDPMAGNADYTLRTRVGQSFDNAGNMTGNDFQQAVRGLRRDTRAVSNLPYGHDFGQVTGTAEDALKGLLDRQAPGVVPDYMKANAAYRHQMIVEDALKAGKNQIDETGNAIFTPAQLNSASVRNGGMAFNRPFKQLAEAGQQVLPSKIPDSGTAGRAALGLFATTLGGGAVGGAGGAFGGDAHTGSGIGATAGLAAGLMNTRMGQRALTAMLLKRPSKVADVGQYLLDNQSGGGTLGAGLLLPYFQGR